jgi:hypothetical protein
MSTTFPTLTESGEQTDSPLTDPEVRAFCEQHQIVGAAIETARMLWQAFPTNRGVELALKRDPETSGVCWLTVTIRAHGPTSELVRAYDAFLDRWVPAITLHVRDRITPTFTTA